MGYLKRTRTLIEYHGRKGYPQIHISKSGRLYITVRKKGGGVKRLYKGSFYYTNHKLKKLNFKSPYSRKEKARIIKKLK